MPVRFARYRAHRRAIAANIAARHGSGFAEYHRAARQSVIIGSMADQDTRNVRQALHRFNMLASSLSGDSDCSTS